jgi:hypothetical protein
MSAYVVSKEHIDALICAGLAPNRCAGDKLSWRYDDEWRKLDLNNADAVGAMLWAENVASVDYRYSPPGREAIYGEGWTDAEPLPGTYQLEMIAPGVEPIETPEWSSEYRYPLMRVKLRTPVEVLKLISCFEYQSCEHPDWDESEAYAFCEALRHRMIDMLPGYDAAPWGL